MRQRYARKGVDQSFPCYRYDMIVDTVGPEAKIPGRALLEELAFRVLRFVGVCDVTKVFEPDLTCCTRNNAVP